MRNVGKGGDGVSRKRRMWECGNERGGGMWHLERMGDVKREGRNGACW